MSKTEQEQRKTTTFLDIHIAAFIELNGIPAELRNNNGRIVFNFPQGEDVYRLANLYNSNEPVLVADYVSVLRTLKAKMFSMKSNIREGISRV